jgi:hypothetical protein
MIDQSIRRSLSQDLRRLITGRMTNDAFDDVYYESYHDSNDRAVREIAGFGYSLYSSDLLWPYRLRGRYTVDKETRSAAARCVLFLRSGCDYEWPDTPHLDCAIASLSFSVGIPLGAALCFFWLPIAIDGWDSIVGSCAVVGTLLLAASIVGLRHQPRLTEEQGRFYQAGDFELWPFLHRHDFDQARRTAHLLHGMQ